MQAGSAAQRAEAGQAAMAPLTPCTGEWERPALMPITPQVSTPPRPWVEKQEPKTLSILSSSTCAGRPWCMRMSRLVQSYRCPPPDLNCRESPRLAHEQRTAFPSRAKPERRHGRKHGAWGAAMERCMATEIGKEGGRQHGGLCSLRHAGLTGAAEAGLARRVGACSQLAASCSPCRTRRGRGWTWR